jgi:phage tail-like protein
MALADNVALALSNRFKVTVDAPKVMDLGSWGTVAGLEVTIESIEYRAGDSWNQRWYSPGATKYENIKLSRTVTAATKDVKNWLSMTALKHVPGSMKIVLLDAAGEPVHDWEVRSAMPVKWSVGGFDATANKLAIETLEIVHLGFLDDERAS